MNKKYLILILLSLLSVITFLDRNAISIAGVRITQELGLNESQFGWILTAFTLSYGLLEIPMGLWGDRFGEKKIIVRIVFWWSLFTALTGLVTGFASLFVVRFLFGAGEAGAYPNSAISIRKWFPVAERGRAQSFIWMASRIGGAIAPFVVVPLQIQYGWRTTFYFLGGIGLLWLISWILLYPTHSPEQHLETNTVKPTWSKLIGNKNFWLLLAMYYCYASGVFFYISWLPKYLINGRGIAESELAYSAALPFLLAALGCWLGGFISDWLVTKIGFNWGRKIVPIVGLSISGLVMLISVFTKDNSIAIIFLALGLAFMDVTAPVAWAVATDIGGKASGAITGAMNTSGLLGGTVASLGIGYLISWNGSYQFPVILIAIQLIAGAAFALALRIRNQEEELART